MERLKNLLISNKAQARMRDTDDEEESEDEYGSSWVELVCIIRTNVNPSFDRKEPSVKMTVS